MKILLILLMLIFAAIPAFSYSTVLSLYPGVNGNYLPNDVSTMTNNANDSLNSYGGIVLGISGFLGFDSTDFYLSSNLSVCLTLNLLGDALVSIYGADIRYGLLTEESLVAGWRWPGENRAMGFFLGAGPALQQLWGIDASNLSFIGGLIELGFQTNKTRGVGFHFKTAVSGFYLLDIEDQGLQNGVYSIGLGIFAGISWNRIH